MKKILAGVALFGAVGLGALAYAQTYPVPQVPFVSASDLFADAVNGIGSVPTYFATAGQISNTTSVVYTALGAATYAITQGAGTTWTILNYSGTITSGTFTFNATPTNGSRACLVSATQAVTTATFTGNTGQTVTGAPTSMTAGTPVCFTYVSSVSTWFKS